MTGGGGLRWFGERIRRVRGSAAGVGTSIESVGEEAAVLRHLQLRKRGNGCGYLLVRWPRTAGNVCGFGSQPEGEWA